MDPRDAALIAMAITPRAIGQTKPHPCWIRWADTVAISEEARARLSGKLTETARGVLRRLQLMKTEALRRDDDQLFMGLVALHERYISDYLSRQYPRPRTESKACMGCNLMYPADQIDSHSFDVANKLDVKLVLCGRCKKQVLDD